MARFIAEALGTFALVFVGCGAIVVDAWSGGALGHPGVALAFGLVVMTMIYAVGDVSGAHLNPAVSLGFALARRMPAAEAARFGASQCLGALVAAGLLRLLFGLEGGIGATQPIAGIPRSLVMEAVLTFLLMFVILSVSTGAKEKGITAGIAVGGTVALAALVGGPVSGASLNPARSLGPALAAGQLGALWLYLTAPCAGAGLAVAACRAVHPEGCCRAPGGAPARG